MTETTSYKINFLFIYWDNVSLQSLPQQDFAT